MIKLPQYSIGEHEQVTLLLHQKREVDYVPRGDDMLPFIRGGKDTLRLQAPDRPIGRGTIVLAQFPDGNCRLRRVMDRNRNRLYLLKDAATSWTETEECTMDDILGRVVFIKRGARRSRPGRGLLWLFLLPLRRYLLPLYKRIWKKNLDKTLDYD